MEELGKFFKLLLWVTMGIFIIPCMVVTAVLYPMWEKMGDNF